MVDRLDLECAISDAEGAAAVVSILEDRLMSSTVDGWKRLGLEPRDDMVVWAFVPDEGRALNHASTALQVAVAEVSRIFYALVDARKL